ncbi:MAG: tetratricopeptide repeat protein [Pseudomonadota bacterium]
MPILVVLTLLVQIAACIHVARNGREYWWILFIIAAPWLGALVYFAVHILPGMRHSKAAKQIKTDVGKLIDPDKDYRLAANDLADVETVETLSAMAEQLMQRQRYEEAAVLLNRSLKGVHEHDADTLIRLAEAYFLDDKFDAALGALDRVQEHHPGYRSRAGHLLYARSLEALGRDDEALSTYADLVGYANEEEPRVRYALLLRKTGRPDEARGMFETVVNSVERGGKVYFQSQKDWYQVAKDNL